MAVFLKEVSDGSIFKFESASWGQRSMQALRLFYRLGVPKDSTRSKRCCNNCMYISKDGILNSMVTIPIAGHYT